VDVKMIKEYYQILVHTLLRTFVDPFKRQQSRQVISANSSPSAVGRRVFEVAIARCAHAPGRMVVTTVAGVLTHGCSIR
jgi:hypothetical protein